ncbi:MAG TPA: tellurite resistance TerB family protein, partial [Tianweitania sediminis]|nr:tellurite resistance TerB family protein [Tianweitania sediminis]
MFDPKKLLDQFLGSQAGGAGGGLRDRADQALQYARNNPGKSAALASMLLGTKTGRNLGSSALKLGGMAAVAGLAYTAYQQYQKSQSGQGAPAPAAGEPAVLPAPEDTGFHPSRMPEGEDAFTLVLVRAMIAAARADGHIDEEERQRIAGRLSEAGVDREAEQFVKEELARPVDLDAIVRAGQTEEQRVEIYTASRVAIEPETRAERGYLDQLAGRLQLDDRLVD